MKKPKAEPTTILKDPQGRKIETGRAPLSAFKPYPQNARTHPEQEIALLAEIIKKYGDDQDIVVDEDWTILKGHGRKIAAERAGRKDFGYVQRFGLTPAEKAEMRISDNSLPLLAGWDAELIKGELELLKGADGLGLLGFAEATLRGFGVAMGTTGADPEATPEPSKKPSVRRGDMWALGEHRLLCGDSTVKKDVERLLGSDRPNLMVTDPPYGVEYDADWRNSAQRKNGLPFGGRAIGKVNNDDRSDWSSTWALFGGDVAYVWHGALYVGQVQQHLLSAGLQPRALIVWAKNNFAVSRGHYHWQHETCWYVVRQGKTGNWHGGRSQTTVWNIDKPRASETGHSTQKPIECMKRPIENNSSAGDFIYDPFVGSGTTLIACEMTKRRCLAVEIDPAYCQVVIERWEKFTNRKATLDGKTLEQVAKARRTGEAIRDEAGDSGKSVSRKDAGGNGGERTVRAARDARLAPTRRKPAGKPSVVAGNT